MPTFVVTGPDGKKYRVNAPQGAGQQQAIAYVADTYYKGGQQKSPIENIPLVGGALAAAADIPLSFGEGLAGVGKTFTDVFGAKNAASNFLEDVADTAARWKSAESKQDAATAARIQKEAEGKGIWEETKAAIQSYALSPLETTASVTGSAVPFIAAALAAPETGGTSLLPIAAMAGLGTASGVGMLKGDIYDAVYEATYEQGVKQGLTEAQAKARAEQAADKAQEYGGENLDQIALGGAFGAAASATGFGRQIANTIGKRAAARLLSRQAEREAAEAAGETLARKSVFRGTVAGAAEEAIPEAAQAAQERYAQNLALQREGFDIDVWKGVAGQAAFEGIASLALGGYGGARETSAKNLDTRVKALKQEYDNIEPETPAEALNEAVVRLMRRGFSREEADRAVTNMVRSKQELADQEAALRQQQEEARAERTAGIEPSPEPNIYAPGIETEEQLAAPPATDAEEEAARMAAYAPEAAPLTSEPDTGFVYTPDVAAARAAQMTDSEIDLRLEDLAGRGLNDLTKEERFTANALRAEKARRVETYAQEAGYVPQAIPEVAPAGEVQAPPVAEINAAPSMALYPTGEILTPERANLILEDADALDEYVNRGNDIETLRAVARGEDVGYQPKYARRAKDTQTASLGFDMPVQAAPGEAMKRAEFEQFRFAPEEQKAALREQAADEQREAQFRLSDKLQREADEREEVMGDLQYALQAQAPENAVYKTVYDPQSNSAPYKLIAERELGKGGEEVLTAKTLQEFSDQIYGRMMELTPYIPPAPAALEEVAPTESFEQKAPTVATRMVQDFVNEVSAAHEAGQIDNNQRAQLLQRMYRPNAYRMVNGREVPNDAIAKYEAAAIEAKSVENNALAADKEAATAARKEADETLRKAVRNSLLNPARAQLKSMVEMRQDEKLGARIRAKEAEKTIAEEAKRPADKVKAGQRLVSADTKQAREAKKELREAKIDLAQQRVQKYRKGAEKQPGGPPKVVSVADVQAVVDAVTKNWKSKVRVEVVESIMDIKDAKLKRAIMRDNALDANGLVAPDGTIYLVADNLLSTQDAKAVLFHEALGHLGLEKLFRNNLDQALVAMYRGNAKLKADVEKWRSEHRGAYENDKNPLARAIEEVLAERSERGQLERSFFQKIAAIIRNFARRMGMDLAISDNDIASILSMAHDKVVNGDTESAVVKGLRYVGGDRIRVPPEAAKTFLKELGLFTNRELMSMDPEEAVTRAARIGVDEEWMDYFMSRRLAARAPEGKEPIKLPQPDMSKYMPKYSRPKTSKADAEKLDEAEAVLSEGADKVRKTFSTYGLNEGLEQMAAGHDSKKFSGAIRDNMDALSPAVWQAILPAMPSSGILNWFKRLNPFVHNKLADIDELVHKMHSMKQRIIQASDELARDIEDFTNEYGTNVIATAQFQARINEFAPDKFASVEEALQKDAIIKAVEKSLLDVSNNKAETRRIMNEIKSLVMAGKDASLQRLTSQLEAIASNERNVQRDVAQLVEMTRRIRDTMAAWDALGKQKNGQRIYKEMRAFYKDMFDAELALLDERIDRLFKDEPEEAKRLRDKRAEMMREIQSPTERKKSGDLFWNIDGNLFEKDYFPFMREGKYWLRVTEDKKAGRIGELYTFDTIREQRAAQKRIAARLGIDPERTGGALKAGWDIGELQDHLRTEDELMQRVFDIIGKVRNDYAADPNKVDLKEVADAIYQTWLMTTPERSVRRRLMHAKEVPGMSSDVLLHFKQQATAYANQLSKLAYAGEVRAAVKNARAAVDDPDFPVSEGAKINAVISEFEKRAEQEINPNPQNALVNTMNRISYYYYLSSAATALINLTSIPIRVVPRLWRDYGFNEGTRMWLKYMKVWKSLGRVKVTHENTRFGDYIDALMPNINGSDFVRNDADLQWAKAAGTERGILETVHDSIVQNERATPKGTKQGAAKAVSDAAGVTAKAMSFLFTGTENITRQAAYYMTFELALNKYRKANPDATKEEARQFALKEAMSVVRDTLGDFSSWERPRLAKNNWTRAFFLFKMHPMLQTKFMVGAMRDIVKGIPGSPEESKALRVGAIKELTGVLGMAGMFGGIMGMPLYWVMTQALMAAFGPDDDDDDDVRALMGGDPRTAYDPDIAFRTWMNDTFGATEIGGVPLSTILTEGPIGALTGTELSSRTTLDIKNMWFRDAVAGDGLEDTLTAAAVANIAGFSMASQVLKGFDQFKEGDNRGALTKIFPAFFRSWVNAYYTSQEGIVTGRKDTLIPKEDITTADMIRTTLGLRSPRVARMQKYYITRARNEKEIKGERDGILDRLEQAYSAGELNTRAQVDKFIAEEVVPFNRTYPDPEFLITEKTMTESIKRRLGIRARTFEGMQLDKKTMPKDVAAQQRFVQ